MRKELKDLSIVLRVIGASFDSRTFLTKRQWKTNRYWVKGEKSLLGKINRDSGFNMDVSRRRNESLNAAVIRFLKKYGPDLRSVTLKNKTQAIIDIGIIDPTKLFYLSLIFDQKTLKMLAFYNVQLRTTFYVGKHAEGLNLS